MTRLIDLVFICSSVILNISVSSVYVVTKLGDTALTQRALMVIKYFKCSITTIIEKAVLKRERSEEVIETCLRDLQLQQ
jgi:hypothetical protein